MAAPVPHRFFLLEEGDDLLGGLGHFVGSLNDALGDGGVIQDPVRTIDVNGVAFGLEPRRTLSQLLNATLHVLAVLTLSMTIHHTSSTFKINKTRSQAELTTPCRY